MSFHRPTREAAKGKWRGILLKLGMPEACLTGKHGPCPMCGGKDRFRWDNHEGRGTFICALCGAGDGMALAERLTGKAFKEVASMIDAILGNEKSYAERPKPARSDEERERDLRRILASTRPMKRGDLADIYLGTRNIDEVTYAEALRFGHLPDGDGSIRPAMVAIVSGPDGKLATLHRTFLRPDGKGKAEMAQPRRFAPGKIPDGSCVRLSNYSGGPLGIAEGIETALSASALFELPVWAATNSTLLAKWAPPEGCNEVVVFGDHDPSFGGQAAAYRLAQRLTVKGIAVSVQIPPGVGDDWADVLMYKKAF